ncbi:hypothetical protein Tcan_11700 [Toxocara canis]|uniref:Uncharacterized protein n=1 Tax=Toxocara canis TaxID=6265 RepID=A0A0B2V1Y0_TOXCA|nr:hypothetical protein Tcan_11700 [Toxocara canis]
MNESKAETISCTDPFEKNGRRQLLHGTSRIWSTRFFRRWRWRLLRWWWRIPARRVCLWWRRWRRLLRWRLLRGWRWWRWRRRRRRRWAKNANGCVVLLRSKIELCRFWTTRRPADD